MNEPPGGAPEKRLLVVDDDPDIAEIVAEVATMLGFRAASVSDATQFEPAFRDHDPHMVVLDLNMPNTDGIELLRFLSENASDTAVLLMSGLDTRTLASAERLGRTHGLNMLGTLQKPIDIAALEEVLGKTL